MLGGYITVYFGWQWMFYFLAIIGFIITLLAVCFMEETLYVAPSPLPSPSSSTAHGLKIVRPKVNFNAVSQEMKKCG
jgi:MFS family permease